MNLRKVYVLGHFASKSSNDKVQSNLNDLTRDPTGDITIKLGYPKNNINLKGYQYGEKFGHSLCAVDINGDGYDDLVVGAPFHSHNDKVGGDNLRYTGHCFVLKYTFET